MKLKTLLFMLFALFGSITLQAYDAYIDGIYYSFSGSSAIVTNKYLSYNQNSGFYSGPVVIPQSVTYNGKTYSVTAIGDYAFHESRSLTSLIIPDGITRIGSHAVAHCASLTSIVIPNSVTYIDEAAFEGCNGLTLISIPNSITSIKNYVFKDCSSLTSVSIPSNIASIGYEAFSMCDNLTSVTVERETPASIDETSFSNRRNATLYVPNGRKPAYEAASYWKEFKEIKVISDAAETTTYSIGSAQELVAFANKVNAGSSYINAVLTADIDLSGVSNNWTPIGKNNDVAFKGQFDGQGHIISNLSIDNTNDYQGLIGIVGDGAVIKNFVLDNTCWIMGKAYCGVVGGTSGSGDIYIENVGNEGTVMTTNKNAAGILGVDMGGLMNLHIKNCYVTGQILGGSESGAICGYSNENSEVINCWSTAYIPVYAIYSSDSFTRGSAKVTNCYEADIEGVNPNKQQHINPQKENYRCNAIIHEEVANGALCFKLNRNQSNEPAWFQTLLEDEHPYPNDSHGRVYMNGRLHCNGDVYDEVVFSNEYNEYTNFIQDDHIFVDGFCSYCGLINENYLTPNTEDFYELATAKQLAWFAQLVNTGLYDANAVLTADIDLSGVSSNWTPIGKNNDAAFKGHFDGQGHTITNFNATTNQDGFGLFGVIHEDGIIENFTIYGTITNNTYSTGGGVVGYISSDGFLVRLYKIHSHININNTLYGGRFGGFVGSVYASRTYITSCTYSGTIKGSDGGSTGNYGGFVGYVNNNSNIILNITNCLFDGKLINSEPEGSTYGGFVGYSNKGKVTIKNCLSVGYVQPHTNNGQFFGAVNSSLSSIINSYYVSGNINGAASAVSIPATLVTESQLASGEICYALNGDQTEINWYQTLGIDNYPVLDNSHKPVLFINGSYVNEIHQYTIIFDTNGGSLMESITQDVGSAITPPADPTREGYTFLGWEPAIPETMPAGGLTCVAQWQINSYTLTYLVDGEEYKSSSVNYGTTITPEEEPTKEGYTFSGWSEIPKTMPAHDVTITGTFTVNSYAVFYMVDGEEYARVEVEYGAAITPLETPTKEGYTFSGWSYIPPTMPAADVVVMGTFSINSYTLTYVVDGEEYKTSTVTYGSAITPEEEPTKEGYTFSGWSEIPETMPAGDVVVTGSFSPNGYTLLYIVDGEEYKTESVAYGTTITPEAEPTKEGYTFSGWSEIPETMPAENVTVTGSFTINQYLLTYILDGEEYKSYEIDYNTALTPEPVPTKKGMTFSGWGEMPETMPAHDVTLTGAYTWSKETVDGVVYQVADTLNNYATIVGYEGTDGEAEILSYIEIGGDIYEVYSIADNALQKSVTIYTSVGRLLLWLWTNGYANIRETETGNSLSAPEVSLVGATASSLKLSFANPYPELNEMLTVSGTPVEKGENGYEIALNGLEPDNLYDELASVTLTYEDASYTKSYSFRTEPLTLTALQPKVVSIGNVIVVAESNLDDDETNVGFEWRRIDWTDDFESRTGAAYLYEGIMEGYIRSLNADRLWKFRPYYTSNAGNTYYSDWKGMDPSDYSFFEPTVHTYEPIAVTDSTAEVKGYAMQGTDDVACQGFMYWQTTSPASSRMRANGAPEDATVVEVPGHVMKTTLAGLEYDTEYCFVAFVKTGNGTIFYGEQQSFRTNSDPDGIKEIKNDELRKKDDSSWYSLDGKKLAKPQRGINIIRYSDGTTKKVLIK